MCECARVVWESVLPIVGTLRTDYFFFCSLPILCWRCARVCSSARFFAGGVLRCAEGVLRCARVLGFVLEVCLRCGEFAKKSTKSLRFALI